MHQIVKRIKPYKFLEYLNVSLNFKLFVTPHLTHMFKMVDCEKMFKKLLG